MVGSCGRGCYSVTLGTDTNDGRVRRALLGVLVLLFLEWLFVSWGWGGRPRREVSGRLSSRNVARGSGHNWSQMNDLLMP